MTLPAKRTRAIIYTKLFLEQLLVPRLTPDVPESVRAAALGCCATILELATLKSRTVCCRTGSVLREK